MWLICLRSDASGFCLPCAHRSGARCRSQNQWAYCTSDLFPKTGDQVTILSSNNAAPSRDWLNRAWDMYKHPRTGQVNPTGSSNKTGIANVVDGRAILEDELKRLSIEGVKLADLAKAVNYQNVQDMFAAIGAGDLKPTQVAHGPNNWWIPMISSWIWRYPLSVRRK